MIEAILFDLDGVLVDACDWHYHAFNKALGFKITEEEQKTKYNGLSTKKKLEMLCLEGRIYKSDIQRIWDLKQKYIQEYIKTIEHDHEKISMMQKLFEDNIKLACVTNAIRKTAVEMLIRSGIIEYMSLIVSNEDVKLNKPHPDCYLFALDKLMVSPRNTMIIEDSDVGYEAAIKVTPNVLRVENSLQTNYTNVHSAIKIFNDKKY